MTQIQKKALLFTHSKSLPHSIWWDGSLLPFEKPTTVFEQFFIEIIRRELRWPLIHDPIKITHIVNGTYFRIV